ncbi:MAG: TetR/AcrR family transcriptional regulator [Pseudomonadota bacterium]
MKHKSGDLELLALGNMVNSSEAMFERRRRIIREARKIMNTHGLDGLNMRSLSEKADVSTRTIYNAFGSKETVIALTIQSYYDKFMSNVNFPEDIKTFNGSLIRQVTITSRDTDVPNYMKAIVSLYFSPTLHADIREVLQSFATWSWSNWLTRVQALRQLEKGINVPDLLSDLANIQYARIHEWTVGLMDDRAFIKTSLSSILVLLTGATRGTAREEARAALAAINTDSAYMPALIEDVRARIAAVPLATTKP